MKQTLLIAALISTTFLGACGKRHDESLGQRVDGVVAGVQQGAVEVKADSQAAADTAAAKVNEAADALGEAVTDATITTKINGALAADDRLKASQIDVDTKDGVVTLTGTAPDARSVTRATEMAVAVRGVRSVTNRLVVRNV